MIKNYYILTKPGIIYGNLINTIAGFLFASKFHINVLLLLSVIVGTSLIIASACVINNYFDSDIDAKMNRTKQRPSVTGYISKRNILLYATLLGIIGLIIVIVGTNLTTVIVGLIGFIDYVFFYTFLKRKTVYGTIIGSISGATPPVAGYVAVTNHIDIAAILLFLILVFWQMPHFYAIAIYRAKDYKTAKIPVLPLVSGIKTTQIHMLFYIFAFIIANILLTFFGYAGKSYAVVLTAFGVWWLWIGVKGFRLTDTTKWARKMFFYSLIITLIFAVMLALNMVLP